MLNLQQIDKTFVLTTILMLIYGITMSMLTTSAATAVEEILEQNEIPDAEENSNQHFTSPMMSLNGNNVCHVEFTVIKRAAGHCIKIGKNMRGCMSGTYFHPYHFECI
jgi:hypothetical protein